MVMGGVSVEWLEQKMGHLAKTVKHKIIIGHAGTYFLTPTPWLEAPSLERGLKISQSGQFSFWSRSVTIRASDEDARDRAS